MKEKANELVYKMAENQVSNLKDNGTFSQLDRAKQCALIAVDFAIKNNRKLLDSQLNNDFDILANINELTELKQEIQKL